MYTDCCASMKFFFDLNFLKFRSLTPVNVFDDVNIVIVNSPGELCDPGPNCNVTNIL